MTFLLVEHNVSYRNSESCLSCLSVVFAVALAEGKGQSDAASTQRLWIRNRFQHCFYKMLQTVLF